MRLLMRSIFSSVIFSFFIFPPSVAQQNHFHAFLKEGQTQSLDVVDTHGNVLVGYELWTDDQSAPKIRIVRENHGFESEVKSIKRISFIERVSRPAQQVYSIEVSWQPGADFSDCLIEITHPDVRLARLKLYMNY